MKIAIVATHPIQYQVPWYRQLASRSNIELTVFYAMIPDENQQGIGFDVPFQWDIPMLDGYKWELLKNTAKRSGLGDFFSCNTPEIAMVLKRQRPDAAIITGWQSFSLLQSLVACNRLKIPCLVRGDSNLFNKRPWTVRLMHRILVSRFDAYLAVGRANRDFYMKYGVDSKKIFKCLHFIDNERFKNHAEMLANQRRKIRAEWEIPDKAVCFLYAGKLIEKKRIGDLIGAMELSRNFERPIFLLVVGSGELLGDVKATVEEKRLPVAFAGFLNQTKIVRAYVAADCLCLPSDYGETWGLVVNEAMACGRPAIVSDRVGCGPDLVIDGLTGFVFPCGDVDALAERIVLMAKDCRKMKNMGKNAQRLVLARYSVANAVDGATKAIDFVLETRRNRQEAIR